MKFGFVAVLCIMLQGLLFHEFMQDYVFCSIRVVLASCMFIPHNFEGLWISFFLKLICQMYIVFTGFRYLMS